MEESIALTKNVIDFVMSDLKDIRIFQEKNETVTIDAFAY